MAILVVSLISQRGIGPVMSGKKIRLLIVLYEMVVLESILSKTLTRMGNGTTTKTTTTPESMLTELLPRSGYLVRTSSIYHSRIVWTTIGCLRSFGRD